MATWSNIYIQANPRIRRLTWTPIFQLWRCAPLLRHLYGAIPASLSANQLLSSLCYPVILINISPLNGHSWHIIRALGLIFVIQSLESNEKSQNCFLFNVVWWCLTRSVGVINPVYVVYQSLSLISGTSHTECTRERERDCGRDLRRWSNWLWIEQAILCGVQGMWRWYSWEKGYLRRNWHWIAQSHNHSQPYFPSLPFRSLLKPPQLKSAAE